jgi:hypothetical protein
MHWTLKLWMIEQPRGFGLKRLDQPPFEFGHAGNVLMALPALPWEFCALRSPGPVERGTRWGSRLSALLLARLQARHWLELRLGRGRCFAFIAAAPDCRGNEQKQQ